MPCGTFQRAPIWWPSVCERCTRTLTTPAMLIQPASCASRRAPRSAGSAALAGSAVRSVRIACVASVSVNGCARGPHIASQAWSIAFTPVESQSSRGVATVTSGSRTIANGAMRGSTT